MEMWKGIAMGIGGTVGTAVLLMLIFVCWENRMYERFNRCDACRKKAGG